MTTHLPSSTAGLAAIRYRLGGPAASDEGDIRTRCTVCDTWYWVSEGHQCSPAAVLAAALPVHPLIAVWAAENDLYAIYRRNGGRIVPAILDTPRSAA